MVVFNNSIHSTLKVVRNTMTDITLAIVGGGIVTPSRKQIPSPQEITQLIETFAANGFTLKIVLADPAHPTVHDAPLFASPEYQEHVTIYKGEFRAYYNENSLPDIVFDFTGVHTYAEFNTHHHISPDHHVHLIPFGCLAEEFNYMSMIEPLLICPPELYANFNHSIKNDINQMINILKELGEMFDDCLPALTDDIRLNYEVLQQYFEIIIQVSDNLLEYQRFTEFTNYIREFYKDKGGDYQVALARYNHMFSEIYSDIYITLRDTASTIHGLHNSKQILGWYYGNFNSLDGIDNKYVPILVIFMIEFCKQHRLFGELDIDTILSEVILQDGSRNKFIKRNSPFIQIVE